MLRFDGEDQVLVKEGESGEPSGRQVGSDESQLATLLRAATGRVTARFSERSGDDAAIAEVRSTLELLSDILLNGPGSFDPDARSPQELAEQRSLLDQLCVETLRGDAASGVAEEPFVAAVEAFARVRRILMSREDADFASLLAPDGSDLVVELAHDLRSPLTSILFLSETLRRGQSGEINEYQRRQLGIIYSAALGL